MAFPLTLLFALALPGHVTAPQAPQTLAAMRDRYRPLIIFTPEDGAAWAQKEKLLASRKELLDRDVMMVLFFHKYAGGWDRKIEANLPGEEGALRRRFHVAPNDFTVILIGKDGGEKFRSHGAITIEQLNQVIDAMPMRQQEMKISR